MANALINIGHPHRVVQLKFVPKSDARRKLRLGDKQPGRPQPPKWCLRSLFCLPWSIAKPGPIAASPGHAFTDHAPVQNSWPCFCLTFLPRRAALSASRAGCSGFVPEAPPCTSARVRPSANSSSMLPAAFASARRRIIRPSVSLTRTKPRSRTLLWLSERNSRPSESMVRRRFSRHATMQ